MIRCIENGVVLTPWGKEYEKCVFIRDGVIDAVCTKEEYGAKAEETIDAKGEYVSAGFIDIHTVSYTHLDVYKRQAQIPPKISTEF